MMSSSERPYLQVDRGSIIDFGQIDFVNCLPLAMPLMQYKPDQLRVHFASPNDLNKRYADKTLSVGAMSAYYYLLADDFELLPGVSISSQKTVASVLYFHKGRDQAKSGLVAVPRTSASSINLLRLMFVLDHFYRGPNDLDANPDLPRLVIDDDIDADTLGASAYDGFLSIGDAALLKDHAFKKKGHDHLGLTRVDLGQWWQERFDLPMVFGVWAARKDFARVRQDEMQALARFLSDCISWGLNDATCFARVKEEAQSRLKLPLTLFDDYYLHHLDFRLTDRHLASIELFGEQLRRYGLLGRPL
jgi:chorismate dehydratase